MYQAWHYATGYEAFEYPLGSSKEWPKNIKTYDRRDVWVKSFQRSDVKLAGKSQKYGHASYQVSSTIGIQDRVSDRTFEEVVRYAPISVVEAAMQHEVWHHLSVRCRVEKMDGPGDWIASDWSFSSIAYQVLPPSLESHRPSHSGDFPFNLVKSIGVP